MQIICPDCGKDMVLCKSIHGNYYSCSDFPECPCRHGAHPDGTPMGVPGDKEVRELRVEIHEICEQVWGKWDSRHCDKKAMYHWLKYNAPKEHIAEMMKEDLLETKRLLKAHYEEPA